jgi:hypothetical protein
MKSKTLSKNELITSGIIVLPFLIAIPLLLIGLFSLVDNSIQPPFNPNFSTVVIISILHLLVLIGFRMRKKVQITNVLNKKKRILGLIFLPLFIFCSSFLLTMGLKMNLNYWLKSDVKEEIFVTVKNKRISTGRSTDHYIDFDTPDGKMNHKVSKRNYNKYKIGESIKIDVQEGYFEGYFLVKNTK